MKLYVSQVYPILGLPSIIVCDQDTLLTSGAWESYLHKLGIAGNRTTAFTPQSNGQAENTNKQVLQLLRRIMTDTLKAKAKWPEVLPIVQFALNQRPHSITGISPAEVLFRRRPMPAFLRKFLTLEELYLVTPVRNVVMMRRQLRPASRLMAGASGSRL